MTSSSVPMSNGWTCATAAVLPSPQEDNSNAETVGDRDKLRELSPHVFLITLCRIGIIREKFDRHDHCENGNMYMAASVGESGPKKRDAKTITTRCSLQQNSLLRRAVPPDLVLE